MLLDATTKSIEIDLGEAHTTNALPITVYYVDLTTTTTTAGSSDTASNGTTAVTIVAAPAASTQRKVNFISVYNADTISHNVTIQLNNNTTLRSIIVVSLDSGQTLQYTDVNGWGLLNEVGLYALLSGAAFTGAVTHIAPTSATNPARLQEVSLYPTVASAATPDIFGAAGITINYTGTTTATDIADCTTAQVGMTKTIITTGAAPFTASASMTIDGYSSGTVTYPAGSVLTVTALTINTFAIITVQAYGTFTATLLNCTTAPTLTYRYSRVGRQVTISPNTSGSFSGTKSGAGYSGFSGIPDIARPNGGSSPSNDFIKVAGTWSSCYILQASGELRYYANLDAGNIADTSAVVINASSFSWSV